MSQTDLINAQKTQKKFSKKLLSNVNGSGVYSTYQPSQLLLKHPLKKLTEACRRYFAFSLPNWIAKPLLVIGALSLASQSQMTYAANITDVNALITQAINTHPLVQAARSDEQATSEYVNAAKLNMLPLPIIGTTYQKGDGLVSRAGMRQSIWTGGKLTANVNQAIYDDKAAMAYIMEQQNTVAKNTIDLWQSYIYSMALQGLYNNNIKNLSEFEAMMKRRVSQGVSARIDLDLVANRILQDQNAWQGAVQQQKIAVARLSQMIGQQISDIGLQRIPLNQMSKYVKSQSGDFEKLAFSQASFNNPTVIKQQFQIESAKQKVKADKASQYPSVYAQFEELYYHKDNKTDGQLSFGVSYDPGAGFSNMATARATEAKVQSYTQNQEASRRTAMENIQTQYQQFISAKDQETSLVAAVAGAQIVEDSYRRQFIAGRKTWLEVLNAVREKAGYQQQLLQVQSQMLGAFYKLQVDFGRMPWQQNTKLLEPTAEFHPYMAFQDWAKQQADKHDLDLNFGNLGNFGKNSTDNTASVDDTQSDIVYPTTTSTEVASNLGYANTNNTVSNLEVPQPIMTEAAPMVSTTTAPKVTNPEVTNIVTTPVVDNHINEQKVEEPAVQEPQQEPPIEQPITQEPQVQKPVVLHSKSKGSIIQVTQVKQPVVQEPKVEQPIAQQPPLEQPITQEPPVEQPIAQQPPLEQPITQEPPVEQPIAQEPPVEQPIAQEPPAEQPIAQEPPVEQPTTQASQAEQLTVQEQKIEKPIVIHSKSKGLIIQEKQIEQPIAQEPQVEQTTTQEPPIEQPALQEPQIEPPVIQEPQADVTQVTKKPTKPTKSKKHQINDDEMTLPKASSLINSEPDNSANVTTATDEATHQ